MCIAVAKPSFDEPERLTWSLGWTGDLVPRGEPRSSFARFEITSFEFIFVWVPEPVCQMTRGKWEIRLREATSVAAC